MALTIAVSTRSSFCVVSFVELVFTSCLMTSFFVSAATAGAAGAEDAVPIILAIAGCTDRSLIVAIT